MPTEKRSIGDWGEEIASTYLQKQGYEILDRNYLRKWGEIDIVCKVPSNVPRGTLDLSPTEPMRADTTIPSSKKQGLLSGLWSAITNVSASAATAVKENVPRGTTSKISPEPKIVFVEVKTTGEGSPVRPEENMTRGKQRRLMRSCQLYISEQRLPISTDWQIDVVAVRLNKETGKAKIEHIERVVYFV